MFIRDNIPMYIRRICLFFTVIIGFLLEYSSGLLPTFFGVKINILLPAVIAIGIFENETTGFVFGLFAGCLIDITNAGADGLNAFYFAVAGCVAGLLMHYLFRTTLFASVFVNFGLCFVYNFGYWIVNVLIPVGDNGMRVFFSKYLIMALISAVIFPIQFYIIKFINRLTTEIEKKYFR